MKKNLLLAIAVFFAFLSLASAQVINKDSFSLVSKIASDKEKLIKLQNSVAQKEKEKMESAIQAQESADDNRKAANKLSDDPQDRKLARRAGAKAGDAKTDARRARNAAQDLDDLNRDIERLKEKIDKEQKRLDKFIITDPLAGKIQP